MGLQTALRCASHSNGRRGAAFRTFGANRVGRSPLNREAVAVVDHDVTHARPVLRAAALAIGLSAGIGACAAEEPGGVARSIDEPIASAPAPGGDDYVLVFSDEFDVDGALDPAKWTARRREVHQKQTLNSARPEMVRASGGSLRMSAKPTPEDPRYPYTAGYIDTDGLFAQTYGRVEFRMRGQYAPGLWYAIWARPWTNAVPEIDVEFLAANVTQAWFVNHWDVPPAPADERRSFVTVQGVDITEFHTYAIVWTPEHVEWQLDGKTFKHVTGRGVPHEPMFWIMNSWVGGWAGDPSPSTIFPAEFEVDWFRVYRPRVWPTEPSIRVGNLRERYSVGDYLHVEVADFDAGASVEMWEGGRLVTTIAKPPFRFSARPLGKGARNVTFVASDPSGARRATASADVVVY